MVAKLISFLSLNTIVILDSCSRYTNELSLFLHERDYLCNVFSLEKFKVLCIFNIITYEIINIFDVVWVY